MNVKTLIAILAAVAAAAVAVYRWRSTHADGEGLTVAREIREAA